jgi:hypothetical protein
MMLDAGWRIKEKGRISNIQQGMSNAEVKRLMADGRCWIADERSRLLSY